MTVATSLAGIRNLLQTFSGKTSVEIKEAIQALGDKVRRIEWAGAWLTATLYSADQIVETGGSAYICFLGHTSDSTTEPGTGASWTTYWALLSSKGDTGPTGPEGPAGGGGGATNLTWTPATSVVASDTGTDATLTVVDGSNPGLMASADKTKLDGVEASATADQTATEIGTAAHLIGLASARPAAAAGNDGVYYTQTDTDGGTLFRSNGSTWVQIAKGVTAGTGATNLSWTAATSVVASDTGTDATLTAVDATNPGLMTVALKSKLDGVEALADVTDATNVTAAGAHMAGGTDVPVLDGGTGSSTAAGARTNLGAAATSHTHVEADITDLGTYLTAAEIDTLAELNAIVTDATLIDTGDARLSDARTPTVHGLGGAEHSTATLAQLNAKVSDATLDDSSAARTPISHTHAAGDVTSGTLDDARIAQSNVTQHEAALTVLESQVTDGTVLARLAAGETVTGAWDFSNAAGVKANVVAESTAAAGVTVDGMLIKDGLIDGRDPSVDGTKLDGIESAATADQSNAEIETAYDTQVGVVSQADAEGGTATVAERWTPQRVLQAIEALQHLKNHWIVRFKNGSADNINAAASGNTWDWTSAADFTHGASPPVEIDGTNRDRININQDGLLVRVTVGGIINGGSSNTRYQGDFFVRKNGTTEVGMHTSCYQRNTGTADNTHFFVTAVDSSGNGDYYEIVVDRLWGTDSQTLVVGETMVEIEIWEK